MHSNKPDPRFEVYTEIADGTGFTIPNCKFIFKFDRFGGWFDEKGTYFNADGVRDDPPSESEASEPDLSHSEGSNHESDD